MPACTGVLLDVRAPSPYPLATLSHARRASFRAAGQVAEFIDEGDDSPEERIAKRRAKEREKESHSTWVRLNQTFNPVAKFLTPVQAGLAELVPKVRQVRYALMWNDRILTFWLAAALAVLTLILALIPWGLLLHWTARLVRRPAARQPTRACMRAHSRLASRAPRATPPYTRSPD